MAAIAFDTLIFVRRLEQAGVPQEQAEAQAELMAQALEYNMDALVTRECLASQLAQSDERQRVALAPLEGRGAALEKRLMHLEARQSRLEEQVAQFRVEFVGQFARLDSRLQLLYLLQGLVLVALLVPPLRTLFGG